MKPFVLTQNVAQAKVFGAGYPSLASMTVNDWYEQHRKFGALPDQGIAKTTSGMKGWEASSYTTTLLVPNALAVKFRPRIIAL